MESYVVEMLQTTKCFNPEIINMLPLPYIIHTIIWRKAHFVGIWLVLTSLTSRYQIPFGEYAPLVPIENACFVPVLLWMWCLGNQDHLTSYNWRLQHLLCKEMEIWLDWVVKQLHNLEARCKLLPINILVRIYVGLSVCVGCVYAWVWHKGPPLCISTHACSLASCSY